MNKENREGTGEKQGVSKRHSSEQLKLSQMALQDLFANYTYLAQFGRQLLIQGIF